MEFFTNINIIFYLVAYLIGAIPFGLILAKFIAKVDIKSEGSKSIGATNVLRVVSQKDAKLGKKLSIATLVLDALKGIVILLVATIMNMPTETLWAIAVLSVLGHCYSPYLMFEGGKGVATSLGVFLFLLPIQTLIALVIWAGMIKFTKISSLSSLSSALALGVSSYFLTTGNLEAIGSSSPVFLIIFIVFYKHIPNIVKLIRGKESSFA